ncbi:MAG: hypothetical protein ACRDD8_11285 [Bacteroidales bacterium]
MKLVHNSLLEFNNASNGGYVLCIEGYALSTLESIEHCVKYAESYVDYKVENRDRISYWLNATFDVVLNDEVIGHIKQQNYTFKFFGINEKIAPNGEKSKLCPELYDLVRTDAFKQWFGDWENDPNSASKVVDENGEPLVVYHGTKSEFDEFDSSASRGSGLKEQWFCFTDNENIANFYASYDGNQGTIMKTFLNIREMPVIDGEYKNWREARMDMQYKIGDIHDIKDAFFHGNSSANITKKDGFCVKNTLEIDVYSDENKHKYIDMFGTTFYVRNPNQIKSIDSRKFSSETANIYEDLLEM